MNKVQILEKAVSVSLYANSLVKRHESVSSSITWAMRVLIEQPVKEKENSELKNRSCVP